MKKEKLKIIYEDAYLIVVVKKSGLLTISTDKEKENTLYHEVSSYLKKKNKNNKVFIVHRLDKDTAGLIVFAKSLKVKNALQDNWDKVIRKYYGIVNGVVDKNKDTLTSFLKETKTHYVYSTKSDGKLAILDYQILVKTPKYTLLDITIKTGRKHQIRVQLNDIKHSLVGDKTYDKCHNKGIKQLYLFAYFLEFTHPITKKTITLKCPYPEYFKTLIDYKA